MPVNLAKFLEQDAIASSSETSVILNPVADGRLPVGGADRVPEEGC